MANTNGRTGELDIDYYKRIDDNNTHIYCAYGSVGKEEVRVEVLCPCRPPTTNKEIAEVKQILTELVLDNLVAKGLIL